MWAIILFFHNLLQLLFFSHWPWHFHYKTAIFCSLLSLFFMNISSEVVHNIDVILPLAWQLRFLRCSDDAAQWCYWALGRPFVPAVCSACVDRRPTLWPTPAARLPALLRFFCQWNKEILLSQIKFWLIIIHCLNLKFSSSKIVFFFRV